MSVLNNYSPALSTTENERVDYLMIELEKIRKIEDKVARELRQLIYKIEARR